MLQPTFVYHDGLKRCKWTAKKLGWGTVLDGAPGPWKMGPFFEGREITEHNIDIAQTFVENPHVSPLGGESFGRWLTNWMQWLTTLNPYLRIAVVTHNRNIQALLSFQGNTFVPKLYNVPGPDFLDIYYTNFSGLIDEWNSRDNPPGIYLIRHVETEWGT